MLKSANSKIEFSSYWNKFKVGALENIVVLISDLLIQAKTNISSVPLAYASFIQFQLERNEQRF